MLLRRARHFPKLSDDIKQRLSLEEVSPLSPYGLLRHARYYCVVWCWLTAYALTPPLCYAPVLTWYPSMASPVLKLHLALLCAAYLATPPLRDVQY